MPRKLSRFSLFAQPLDRAALLAFLLGSVVPFAILAWMLNRYASEILARPQVIALIVSAGVLALGSFLALRRTMIRALDRANKENQRARALVRSSDRLAKADDEGDVIRAVVACGAELAGARAAYFMVGNPDGTFDAMETLGADARKLESSHWEEIEGLAALASADGDGSAREAVAGGVGNSTASGIGIGGLASHPLAAILVVHEGWHPPEPAEKDALITLARLATATLRNAHLREAQRNFFTHVTNLLVTTLDAHYSFQRDHSRRVAQLAHRIGREMGFDSERLHRLHFAALLHDIGMLKLSPGDLKENPGAVRAHPELGFEMLEKIELWKPVAKLVRHHHEWYNGKGYPDGLSSTEIPLESRIIGVVEALDSMTATQSYRPSLPLEDALSQIELGAGRQFDPEIAQIVLQLAANGELLEFTK